MPLDPLTAAMIAVEDHLDELHGPEGPQGKAGVEGPVGPRGPEGPEGPQGPIGPKGPKGDKGDRGLTGRDGLPGEKGQTGPQGPEGPAGLAAPRYIPRGGGGGSGTTLAIQDEGVPLATDATTLNFTGAGVTASGGGATKTIDIPGGGGGLPPQWTDGGHGDVTATTDAGTNPTITIKATAAQEADPVSHLFSILSAANVEVAYIDNESPSGSGGAGGTFAIGRLGSGAGQLSNITWDDDGAGTTESLWSVNNISGWLTLDTYLNAGNPSSSYSQLVIHEQPSQTTPSVVIEDSSFTRLFAVLAGGAPVIAQTVAPADADLGAGELALWFDQTNGAAKTMYKAKSANGTVVTGALPALTGNAAQFLDGTGAFSTPAGGSSTFLSVAKWA